MPNAIWDKHIPEAIEKKFPIPSHIQHCANVAKEDLFNGPTLSIIPKGRIEDFLGECYPTEDSELAQENAENGDLIVETFAHDSPVYEALISFLEMLPREIYYDSQSGELCESLPVETEEEEGELFYNDFYTVSHSDIVKALFGSFFAREFPN